MTAGCLQESTVLAFLGGTLPPDDRTAVEAHVADCGACADLVTWAAVDRASSDRVPGHEGRPFIGQLQPGARVGRYLVLGAVGRGGMGEVYAAYHPDLDRKIALKVVYEIGGGAGERRGRLLREARAIARLSHPNVVTVHDAGTFDDRVYIAMEFVDGATVDEWLEVAPRSWREILDVFIAAGRGLAAAHAADVIHRDFKPQNVMIDKKGAVRVMDFGLARMAHEDATAPPEADGGDSPSPIDTVTKTGALIGTPAYMAPEQFRREKTDARSDQFSFCVALHEALFGVRPPPATGEGGSPPVATSKAPPRDGVPGWLRGVARRGASPEKEKRFASMDALLAALERGRSRPRRWAAAAGAALVVLLIAGGGVRLARGSRFACVVPDDRVAAVWSTDAVNPRRQAVHRAFAASGRATAETSWQRTAAALDDYMKEWSAMYLQACEATNIRREQSAEVLDLRMSCLEDNLNQVRALTDALMTTDSSPISRAVGAARDLTPVIRCADVALLKSAVPLPKDEKTLREVLRLRRELAAIQTMYDLGNNTAVVSRSEALLAEVKATGYKPLLGELLTFIGKAQADEDPSRGEATLREAMIAAQASGDLLTAAKVAIHLIYFVGYRIGRPEEAEFWAQFAEAVLDRLGGDQTRLRAWVLENRGSVRARQGDFEGARPIIEKALALKEQCLGKEHPDVATSLSNLAYVLVLGGHPAEALPAANRAVEISQKFGDPDALAFTYTNQGDALNGLGKYADAEKAYQNALVVLRRNVPQDHQETAFALTGLGEAKVGQDAPGAAVPFLEEALLIRRQEPGTDPALTAETEFVLARALWSRGPDRPRALSLASTARKTFSAHPRAQREQAVSAWLAHHSGR